MNIVFIGCGFVADFYINSLKQHDQLSLIGVWDHDPARLSRFANFYSVTAYSSLDSVLSDSRVELIVNLTNPCSHYSVSKMCLEAGKHVYSEKPLALNTDECVNLIDYANQHHLVISSAPCNLWGGSFQLIKQLLDKQALGTLRLVYAEMDDGLVHKMPYKKWLSHSGTPWPYKDEFEVGCTLEHAAYYVAPLMSLLGTVKSVNAFAACQIPNKLEDEILTIHSADFSVACLLFESGVVVRLTCSIISEHDRSLHIIGDEGVLKMDDCWNNLSPVLLQRRVNIRRRTVNLPWIRKFPRFLDKFFKPKGMDFMLGIAHIKSSVLPQGEFKKINRFALHVNEVVLAIHHSEKNNTLININSTLN